MAGLWELVGIGPSFPSGLGVHPLSLPGLSSCSLTALPGGRWFLRKHRGELSLGSLSSGH